jgi:membrane metallo-endopeptidase-like protein 1
LESEESPDDFESYGLIRKHYRSCMDYDKLEVLGVQSLLDLLKELGGWPLLNGDSWESKNFNWWTWTHRVKKIGLSIDSLITFSLGADDKNTSFRVIGLDQATLGMF